MQYIFFGWLLVFLHFRINGFDLLPDFIGYGLIFAGCHQLSSMSHYFNKTKVIAAFMCLFHFSELLQLKIITIENDLFMIFIVMFNIVLMLVPLLMMYLITKGISTIEEDRQCYLGSDTLMRILKIELFFYVLLFVGTAGVLYLSVAHSKVLWFDLTIATVCILILNLVWVACFYSCKKRFEQVGGGLHASQSQSLVKTKSIVFAFIMLFTILGLTVLSYSEYGQIMRGGIGYIEHVCADKYEFREYITRDSNSIVIDWDNVQASIGQELYDDGECSIYIADIQSDQNGGYRIYFKTKGNFGYQKGRIVTPISHMATVQKNEISSLQNIHKNWPNDAKLQVVVGAKAYLNDKWCARAQSIDKDGDEVGYYIFATQYYESGELVLTDEIRENNNQVTIRLVGLIDYRYERK